MESPKKQLKELSTHVKHAISSDEGVRKKHIDKALGYLEGVRANWHTLPSHSRFGLSDLILEAGLHEFIGKVPVNYSAPALMRSLEVVPVEDKIKCALKFKRDFLIHPQAWKDYEAIFLQPTPNGVTFIKALYPKFQFMALGSKGLTLAGYLSHKNPTCEPLQPFLSMAQNHALSLPLTKGLRLQELLSTASKQWEEDKVLENEIPSKLHPWRKLITEQYGWITNNGDCLACPPHRHLELLNELDPNLPLAQWAKQRLKVLNDRLEEEEKNFDNVSEGEHPESHLYEIWMDTEKEIERQILLARLYHDGWIRIGLKDQKKLCIEGELSSFTKHAKILHVLPQIFEHKYGKITVENYIQKIPEKYLKFAYEPAQEISMEI